MGVNYSGTQAPVFENRVAQGGARPDALISDTANELTTIFEIKLNDGLYNEQIERHFQAFFNREHTTLDDVFVEIKWIAIAAFLQQVAQQSVSERERFVALQFVQYLDWLGLVDFLGFQARDFTAQQDGKPNHAKLNKFLALLAKSPGWEHLKEYDDNWMLWFKDVPYENVYAEMAPHGVDCGMVCGSGKMWRAQRVRQYILDNPGKFRQMLECLRGAIDPSFPIALRVHALFRYSRFRMAWLGDLRGIKPFPDAYDDFVATLRDQSLNAFEPIPKALIQERFAQEIKQNLQRGNVQVDAEGRFPKWEHLDRFLQYSYFHVDVQIPTRRLVGQKLENLLNTFKRVLDAEHEMMRTLNAV